MHAPKVTTWLLAFGALALACKTQPRSTPPSDAGASEGGGADVRSCHAAADCARDEVCEFTPGICGRGKKPGACHRRPSSCDSNYAPVCGCDGKAYDSACSARVAGVDVSVTGGCDARIADWVPCGGHYCDARTSYCEIFLSDIVEPPTDYFCRPLPPSCLPADGAARTCACFPPHTRCGAFCGTMPSAPGGASSFHLTCQGTLPPTE